RHYAQSIALEDEVLQADPQAYEADSIKGIAQAYRGNFTQAMATLDQALALEPDFAGARFNKALTYELFDYYDQAISWYTKALEVEKSCWSYYGIASIYGRRGDVANTVKYLKMAIAINSGTKGAAREEKDFNPVRTSPQFQALLK
ncbi:MAG TPA: hypothetical protein VHQ46_00930, partial [Desulfobacteria bacterium]|nr:hypothetical protein [Desulfobacteria bacterium]